MLILCLEVHLLNPWILSIILLAVVAGYIIATRYIMMIKASILQILMRIPAKPILHMLQPLPLAPVLLPLEPVH